MFCAKCGNQLSENEKFCSKCGAAVSGTEANIKAAGWPAPQPMLMWTGVCMGLIAVIYIALLIGPYRATFVGFVTYLLLPAVMCALAFTICKNDPTLFIAPLAADALFAAISMLMSIGSLRYGGYVLYVLSDLLHIAVAVVFALTLMKRINAVWVLKLSAIVSMIVAGMIGYIYYGSVGLLELLWFGGILFIALAGDATVSVSDSRAHLSGFMERARTLGSDALSRLPIQPDETAPAADISTEYSPPAYSPPARQVHTETNEQSSELLSEVTLKSNSTIKFFGDRVEWGANCVRFSDIAYMDTYGVATTGYAVIIVYSYFTGYIRFALTDGRKLKINLGGFSLYGMGTTRGAKKRYPAIFQAAYKYVAAPLADRALAAINAGQTVTIAGVEVSRERAVFKKLLKREPVVITRENFAACGLTGTSVYVSTKDGKTPFNMTDDAVNVLLLPYVLTALFG
jgi:hypothetical protein